MTIRSSVSTACKVGRLTWFCDQGNVLLPSSHFECQMVAWLLCSWDVICRISVAGRASSLFWVHTSDFVPNRRTDANMLRPVVCAERSAYHTSTCIRYDTAGLRTLRGAVLKGVMTAKRRDVVEYFQLQSSGASPVVPVIIDSRSSSPRDNVLFRSSGQSRLCTLVYTSTKSAIRHSTPFTTDVVGSVCSRVPLLFLAS